MHSDIRLHAEQLFADWAIERSAFETVAATGRSVVAAIHSMDQLGQLGFLHLDFLNDQLAEYRTHLSHLSFEPHHHLVIGIGGSSLGAKAILKALSRQVSPHVKTAFLENVDPVALEEALVGIDWPSTLVTVVSKSGTTLETLALFAIVRQRLKESVSDWSRHVVMITKQGGEGLGAIAEHEELPLFAIPKSVGGRFSVLTAVGMIPSLIAGLDVEEILAGAKRMKSLCQSGHHEENPALALALYQYYLHKHTKRPLTIVMPYCEALDPFAAWILQLWAESIGKRLNTQGQEVREGFTPVKALGSVDQHSQCQLYLEGPRDKWVLFTEVSEPALDDSVVGCDDFPPERRWIEGQTLHAISKAQRWATAQALYEQQTPSATIEIPHLSPYTIGQLFMLFEIQTAYMGVLYNVNAFDQPGVERIKELTFELFRH